MTASPGPRRAPWLLLDCQMPVLDGCDAVREVRRREQQGRTRRLPVVALTASA